MGGTVPVLSLVCMALSCAVGFGLPLGLFLYFRKKGADILPFFVGCAVMLLFAFVLEGALHSLVFASPAGETIRGTLWLYALYGGLMAGLFEESGRLLAFHTVLKHLRGKDVNALMYAAGHGGFEAAALLGVGMLNNLALSLLIGSGGVSGTAAGLSGEALAQMEAGIEALLSTPSYQFLLGGVERISAAVLQLALSVLVWFAAKERGRLRLYFLAVGLHCAVDAATVLLSGLGCPVLLLEGLVALCAALCASCAYWIWKRQ